MKMEPQFRRKAHCTKAKVSQNIHLSLPSQVWFFYVSRPFSKDPLEGWPLQEASLTTGGASHHQRPDFHSSVFCLFRRRKSNTKFFAREIFDWKFFIGFSLKRPIINERKHEPSWLKVRCIEKTCQVWYCKGLRQAKTIGRTRLDSLSCKYRPVLQNLLFT